MCKQQLQEHVAYNCNTGKNHPEHVRTIVILRDRRLNRIPEHGSYPLIDLLQNKSQQNRVYTDFANQKSLCHPEQHLCQYHNR